MPKIARVWVRSQTLVGFVGGLLALLGAASAAAAPSAELWDRWSAHEPASKVKVDHSAWSRFLRTHAVMGADGIVRVRYASVDGAGRGALDGYVASLGAVGVSRLSRPEQQAFWINLYNALTVQVVLAHYPVESIRDISISPGFFAVGPWGKKLASVEGEPVSLDDIEHRILRPIWKDARVHYAVNCASIGCPNLQPVAFTAENTESLLDAGARAYVNHPRAVRVAGGRLTVSSIYDWFEDDFGGNDAGVLEHLRRYADGPLKRALAEISSVDDHEYDWSLNDASGQLPESQSALERPRTKSNS